MSCCKTYDPCANNKASQIGSYAAAVMQALAEVREIAKEIEEFGGYMPTGGGNDKVFYLNSNQVTQSYTLPANENAMSAGPITVVPPAVVTVPPGQAWTII